MYKVKFSVVICTWVFLFSDIESPTDGRPVRITWFTSGIIASKESKAIRLWVSTTMCCFSISLRWFRICSSDWSRYSSSKILFRGPVTSAFNSPEMAPRKSSLLLLGFPNFLRYASILRTVLNRFVALMSTNPELMDLQWLARFSTVLWFSGLVRSMLHAFKTSVMGYSWFRTVVIVRFVWVLSPSFRDLSSGRFSPGVGSGLVRSSWDTRWARLNSLGWDLFSGCGVSREWALLLFP